MTNITIIGGGVSGVLLTIQLLRSKTGLPLSITLIEKEEEPWLGVAYSTNKPFHLLNVRAQKMSALPELDNHFLCWLGENNYNVNADDFAPRFVFRKYIKELFDDSLANKPANIDFRFIRDEAIQVEQINETQAVVHLRNKQTVPTDLLVLALGNFTNSSSLSEHPSLIANPAYYDDPWTANFGDLEKDRQILILGTGPTMVDVVLTLYYQGHNGKITALSRHGLLPSVHAVTKTYPDFSDEVKDVVSLTEAVKIVRKHIVIAEEAGIGWRAVVDAMRPFTQQLWMNISLDGKIDFLKYYKTYWEVSRSRMPEECAIVIKEMINSELLEIIAGRIRQIEKQDPRIAVQYSVAKTRETRTIKADTVINCMGPGLNFEK